MDKLESKLNINKKFLKPPPKEKVFNKVSQYITQIPDYNYMADVLYLPETKQGYKYLLVMADLANGEFDIEPMKKKDSDETLKAMKRIFKRGILPKPYSSIRTDNGTEFKSVFHKFLVANKIFHSVSEPYRHKQLSVVESLNKTLGYLIHGYLNSIEQKTGRVYNEWVQIIPIIRKELNKIRLRPSFTPQTIKYFVDAEYNPTNLKPKFKVGDLVHYKLEYPIGQLGHKQPTSNFRMGDLRWSIHPRKIKKILQYPGKIPFRYVLNNKPNVSYTEDELMKSNEPDEKYEFERIIKKKKVNGQDYFLVKWKGYKEPTWEPASNFS